jgi:hypothetical protein
MGAVFSMYQKNESACILVGNLKERLLGRPWHKWWDDIKSDSNETKN